MAPTFTPPPPPVEWLTTAEAASAAKCSRETIVRALRAGRLRGSRLIKDWRIDRADLDSWIRGDDRADTRPAERTA